MIKTKVKTLRSLIARELLHLALTYTPKRVSAPVYSKSLQNAALDAMRFTYPEYLDTCVLYGWYQGEMMPISKHKEGGASKKVLISEDSILSSEEMIEHTIRVFRFPGTAEPPLENEIQIYSRVFDDREGSRMDIRVFFVAVPIEVPGDPIDNTEIKVCHIAPESIFSNDMKSQSAILLYASTQAMKKNWIEMSWTSSSRKTA